MTIGRPQQPFVAAGLRGVIKQTGVRDPYPTMSLGIKTKLPTSVTRRIGSKHSGRTSEAAGVPGWEVTEWDDVTTRCYDFAKNIRSQRCSGVISLNKMTL